jgi:hypothetical protein
MIAAGRIVMPSYLLQIQCCGDGCTVAEWPSRAFVLTAIYDSLKRTLKRIFSRQLHAFLPSSNGLFVYILRRDRAEFNIT